MYRRSSEQVVEMKELAIKQLANSTENAEKITSLLCDLIMVDTLLNPFPYNYELRSERERLLNELQAYVDAKVCSE